MWIFARGFMLSAVATDEKEPQIVVRFRVHEHAEAFCKLCKLDPARVVSSPGSDYCCRVILLRDEWIDAATVVFGTVGYLNFKGIVDRDFSQARDIAKRKSSTVDEGWAAFILGRYAEMLHSLWNIHMRLQVQVRSNRNTPSKRKILSRFREGSL